MTKKREQVNEEMQQLWKNQLKAFDLLDIAYNTDNNKERIDLCVEALETSIYCTDALREWTRRSKLPLVIKLKLAEAAKQTGLREMALDNYTIDNVMGNCWLIMETRPYMRACFDTMLAYKEMGLEKHAITEAEWMLKCCPNDNLGVRYELIVLYFKVNDLKKAATLLKKYPKDEFAFFSYPRALLAFLTDSSDKDKLLKKAIESNPFVSKYICKPKLSIKEDMYSPGSEEEAIFYARDFAVPWILNKDAFLWLMTFKAPNETTSSSHPQ